jgi:hypothetical protein
VSLKWLSLTITTSIGAHHYQFVFIATAIFDILKVNRFPLFKRQKKRFEMKKLIVTSTKASIRNFGYFLLATNIFHKNLSSYHYRFYRNLVLPLLSFFFERINDFQIGTNPYF